jgi:cell division protein FtsI/penicillin-binding protein 2
LRVIAAGVIIVALLLITRLYFVQIVHGTDYALKAERQYVAGSQKLYDRGTIYFTRKDGTHISAAALQTGFTLAISPKDIEDPAAAFGALNAHVPNLNQDAFLEAASIEGDPYEVIARQLPEDVGAAIAGLDIPGVMVERQRWRTYPAGQHAARSLGFVAYDNDNTLAGRYGLERYYNHVLDHRSDGLFGNFFAELFANLDSVVVDARQAREGDIITTIEPVVQEKLVQTLQAVQAQYGSTETAGIIMDPHTGEIIALDVYPSFDPNHFTEEDLERFGNPLVEHQYEFGSIVKPLTMAAGLDAGAITPETTYNDTGCVTLNTKTFCNFDLKARGVVPMQEILSQSLNVGTSFIAQQLGHERLRNYLIDLGLGTETGIDLPSEVSGDIRNILESPRDIEYSTASFGQGIALTPVQMIQALATLANGGYRVTPHIAKAVRLESGITREYTWGEPEKVFGREAVEATTGMLVTVVDTKLGGGKVKIPEMSVAAKTGTAQIAAPGGGYYENLYQHSIFGYFPASEPRFIILLYTREPQGVQYASETLTDPLIDLTHFLINYYAVPPDRASYETPA